MNITVPVSVGEVIDKVTILEIKSERISDEAKLKNVATELEALRPLVSGGVFDSDELVELTDGLRRVNAELWDCLLYTSPSPRDGLLSRMPSSA